MSKYLIIADVDELVLGESMSLLKDMDTKEMLSFGIEKSIPGVTVDAIMENKGIIKRCNCTNWQEYMQRINITIAMATLRAGKDVLGDDYVKFKVCPWCGSELIERD
jgi:predicted RNA-binding Zn-ribbon protein involved in translation (DUF1610 family)